MRPHQHRPKAFRPRSCPLSRSASLTRPMGKGRSGLSPAVAHVLLAHSAARLVVKGADPLRAAFRCWLPADAPPRCLACSLPSASAHSPEGVRDAPPPRGP